MSELKRINARLAAVEFAAQLEAANKAAAPKRPWYKRRLRWV